MHNVDAPERQLMQESKQAMPCGSKDHSASIQVSNLLPLNVKIKAHLSEICSPLIKVHLLRNLLVPWQRVEHNHFLLRGLHSLVVDNEGVLQALILGNVVEPLLLHARAVENIRTCDNLRRQLVELSNKHAAVGKLVADMRGEREVRRGNELDLDIVVEEELGKRVDGTSVAKVTGEGDGEVIDGTELFTDSKEVEECLRRMLTRTIACLLC